MKIAHVITSLKIGGAEAVLSRLVTHTKDRHNHHVFYFYEGPHVAHLKRAGISLTKIRGLFSPYDPVGAWRLYRALRSLRPDIIHSSLWSANVVSSVCAYLLGIPIVCDVHNMIELNGRLRNMIMRAVSWIPARYIAVGSAVQRSFTSWWRGNDSSRQKNVVPVTLINNGIDASDMRQRGFKRPASRSDFGWNKRDFIIGSVGRLEPEKSYDVLIEAARVLKQSGLNSFKVCIIGDGTARENLESLIKQHDLSAHVYLLGARDAASFYPLFDCYVSSSRTEGLSIALLEALCFGLPVVLTNSSLQHDVIEHGVGGYVTRVGDASELAQYIMMVHRNSDIARRMSVHNKALVTKQFSLTTMAHAYDDVYRDAISH